MSYPKLTPIIAKGTTEPRYLEDRFTDSICAEDFGALGDGVTDDTAAFTALEEQYSDKRVNLHGKTFCVHTPPCKNYYYNGNWKYEVDYRGSATPGERPAYDDNVRMEYGSVHGIGAGTIGRNYCILNNAALEDVWKTNLKDVVAIGEDTLKYALENNITVNGCCAIGRGVMQNGDASGYQNIGIGNFALHNLTTGHRNIAIGALSMIFNTTGQQTVCIGRDTAQCMVDGGKNTILGYAAVCGDAPVGISSWIEKQNQVTLNRMTVVGVRAAEFATGANEDAVVIGAFAANSAKQLSRNVVIGANACRNVQQDRSYEGYDIFTPSAVSATCTLNGTANVVCVFGSQAQTPVLNRVFEIDTTDSDSPLYGRDHDLFIVKSVSGTTATCKCVELQDGQFVETGEEFPSWSGTVNIGSQTACVYTTFGTDEILLTFDSSDSNKAVEGRRVFVEFIVENNSPIQIFYGGWLRVASVTSTTAVVVDDNIDSEGNSNPVFQSGSGVALVSKFELSSSSCLSNYFSSVEAVGYGACVNTESIESSSIFGYSAAGNTKKLYRSVVAGYKSCLRAKNVSESVCIGAFAGDNNNSDIEKSVIIGRNTSNSATHGNSVVIGYATGVASDDSDRNVFVGAYAGNGVSVADSIRNTAIGYHAMSVNPQDGNGNDIKIEDSTAIGEYAQVTGSKQIQLGASGTTVYTYGSVQDRSDARDKADIRDTILGLDFIKALRPVDFRWDYRDSYTDVAEDGTVIQHEKDGSRKRTRFHHGVIAQEVKAVLDEKGIDFGGYQDHKINGGCDVLSIGYGEFIGPLIKSIQELNNKIEQLEEQIRQLTNSNN